jgi:hypothetical protein
MKLGLRATRKAAHNMGLRPDTIKTIKAQNW